MSVAAHRYARALMDVLYPETAQAGLQQLEHFGALLEEQADIRQFLENPAMAGERRLRVLKEISSALGFDRRVSNFVNILVDRGRMPLLDKILDAYRKLLDERLGVVRARITSAWPMDESQQRELSARLESVIGKQVRMEITVDPTLVGGVIAQLNSTVYDGSIRRQLQAFRSRVIGER